MRLTKVQKALKEAGISYEYRETKGCGEITFEHEGKRYMVDEITGNHGNKPSGLYTSIHNWGRYCNQTRIAEAILKKDFN
jgi:hypothetical protein